MEEKPANFVDEYHLHLFNRLEKRSKTFTTFFRGTIIFAFAFLAFILIPLVALQHEEYKYNATIQEQASKKKELAGLKKEVSEIENQLSSLPDLLKELKVALNAKQGEVNSINDKLEEIHFAIDKNTSRATKLVH